MVDLDKVKAWVAETAVDRDGEIWGEDLERALGWMEALVAEVERQAASLEDQRVLIGNLREDLKEKTLQRDAWREKVMRHQLSSPMIVVPGNKPAVPGMDTPGVRGTRL
jgi:hypothetical protein